MIDNPEIPEPERAPSPGDAPPRPMDQPVGPELNGNGGSGGFVPPQPIDPEKMIAWMKATDKELKMLKVNQLILCGAVLFVLFAGAKGIKGIPKLP